MDALCLREDVRAEIAASVQELAGFFAMVAGFGQWLPRPEQGVLAVFGMRFGQGEVLSLFSFYFRE